MSHRPAIPHSLLSLLIAVGLFPAAAFADQVCEYSLYSVWVKRSMAVCEMPVGDTPCGSFLEPETDKNRNALASGNLSKTADSCTNREHIIGVCVLDNTRLAFLDGDPGMLEIGCANMQGTWQVLSLADKRDPQLLKNLP